MRTTGYICKNCDQICFIRFNKKEENKMCTNLHRQNQYSSFALNIASKWPMAEGVCP